MNTQTIERHCSGCTSLTYFFPNSPAAPTGAIGYARDVDNVPNCNARVGFSKFSTSGCPYTFNLNRYLFSSTSPDYTPVPNNHPVIDVPYTSIG
jgi:hypothetical protein